MTYVIAAFALWVFGAPAAFVVFHSWASFMEWLADKPERRDA